MKEIETLRNKLEKAERILKFYADGHAWFPGSQDFGTKARSYLGDNFTSSLSIEVTIRDMADLAAENENLCKRLQKAEAILLARDKGIEELEQERDAALTERDKYGAEVVRLIERNTDLIIQRDAALAERDARIQAHTEDRNCLLPILARLRAESLAEALAKIALIYAERDEAKALLESYQRGWENQRMDLVSERNAAQAERDRLRVALEIAMREHARASWTQIDNAMKAEEKP